MQIFPDQPSINDPSTFVTLFQSDSGLKYPEPVIKQPFDSVPLDMSLIPHMQVQVKDIGQLPPEEFALARRNGFGGSDTGILLGVNPFQTITALLQQKARKTLTEEELQVSEQTAVIKGNDLEPLIIQKTSKAFNIEIIKPTDMLRFIEFPYLTMNFDGVGRSGDQYIPFEIKVVTLKGESHYNPYCELFNSREGFKLYPRNHASSNNSIKTKAQLYGIPPYYYTQLQDEMMALNSSVGFLASLWESTWTLHVYMVHQDIKVQEAIKIEGFRNWQKVEALREKNGFYNE
jgi:hypothetical protein